MTSHEHVDPKGADEERIRSRRERIVAHLLGELDEDEARALEAELASSPDLAAERDRLAATADLVRTTLGEGEALSTDALESLLRRAGTAPPRAWYRRPAWRAAAGFLVLAGAATLGARTLLEGGARVAPQEELLAREDRAEARRASELAGERPVEEELEDLGYASEPAASTETAGAAEESAEAPAAPHAESTLGLLSEARTQETASRPAAPDASGGEVWVAQGAAPTPAGSDGSSASAVLTVTTAGADLRARVENHLGAAAEQPALDAGTPAGGDTGAPAAKRSSGGRVYTGPGNSVPPPRAKAGGPDEWFLGYAGRGSGDAQASGSRMRRAYTGGGGGGGPASPGPSRPSTAGPAAPGQGAAPSSLPPLSPPASAERKDAAGAPEPPAEEPVLADREIGVDELVDFDLERRAEGGKLRFGELSEAEQALLVERRIERILRDCRRRPGERPRDMFFRFWGDNPFIWTRLDPLSTFSVDVDTASYTLARRYLAEGYLPEKAQIRTEEFVNYFDPDVPPPSEGTFRIHTDLAPTPFGNPAGDRWTLRVVVRGKEVSHEERDPLALTFVVDVSGSMRENGRLELVKHGLRLLLAQLDARDTIGIVAFSNEARVVLPPTSAANRGLIETAIFGLQPNGGTNAEAGLLMGYEMALQALDREHTCRVVLLSDGVANIGETDQDRINETVRRRREQGIFLNTIGVGMNNHNDVFLEQLADKGDGVCNYIDGPLEARRALVENFTGAFQPIARDVKIQVEFDPASVARYRLLGYENRAIADQDFRNDAVDAGEVGAGHQVVALYQLELATPAPEAPLATVRLRWKPPTGAGRDPLEDAATEVARPVTFASATAWEGASPGFQRSVIVGQFAEILRRSIHARDVSIDELIAAARRLAPALSDPEFDELIAMMEKSRALILEQRKLPSDYERCLDLLRHNCYRRAECESLPPERRSAILPQLEEEHRRLEEQLRNLMRRELLAEGEPSRGR